MTASDPDGRPGEPGAPVPNPRSDYDRPKEILADPSLSDERKAELLALWQADLDDRLKAEEEGMSVSDPMHSHTEARLADEVRKVSNAKIALENSAEAEPEIHVQTTDARGGSIEHVVRYVLIVGLVLVVLAFLLVGGFMRL
ncbi:MAG: hypothetical protein ACREBO_10060 [Novosphingobium sp.]